MKTGAVSCLSRRGCSVSRLRMCVNLESLTCSERETNTTETSGLQNINCS